MSLHLYNTLTRKIEPLQPADGTTVRFYCCGPTVYGPAHIGNFRTFLLQDVFRRVIESTGLATLHVRNVTDVDDKTIRGAGEAGESLAVFTGRWRQRFEEDCERLGLLEPAVVPSAVEHIPEQIALIERLIDKGLAYAGRDGSIYFRIAAFPAYGKLSGFRPEGNRANAEGRLNDADEYNKEEFADFALWKAWKQEDGENRWESPWGLGRPGWHIECSAMSMKYLGESFDLHSGGVDLIFPHHENEIAQSEGATGQPFARHWLHVAHLRVENQKMSKSLGNLYTLEDLMERGYSPLEMRYALLSGHYRQPLNFTMDSLAAARSALTRLRRIAGAHGWPLRAQQPVVDSWGAFEPVREALLDDLNTPKALGAMFSVLSQLEKEGKQTGEATGGGFGGVLYALGLDLTDEAKPESAEAPSQVRSLAEQRQAARSRRDWGDADRLRAEIAAAGWVVVDTPGGFELSPAARQTAAD